LTKNILENWWLIFIKYTEKRIISSCTKYWGSMRGQKFKVWKRLQNPKWVTSKKKNQNISKARSLKFFVSFFPSSHRAWFWLLFWFKFWFGPGMKRRDNLFENSRLQLGRAILLKYNKTLVYRDCEFSF